MAKLDALQEEVDDTSSHLLLDKSARDRLSSSDDDGSISTVFERAAWQAHKRYRAGGGSATLKITFGLLFFALILTSATSVVLATWLVAHDDHASPSNSAQGHDPSPPPAMDMGMARPTTKPGLTSCGSSAAEALAAGCRFDIFSFGWYAPECADPQLYNTTLYALRDQLGGSPAFYSSRGREIPIEVVENYGRGVMASDEGAVADGQEIRGTWEHYLVSCGYAWQKVQRAAMRNWPLDEWSAGYNLAKRCGPDMLHRAKKDSESPESYLKPWYPACGLEAEDIRREIAH
ncbi:hypothetical protein UA08_07394 [Talaromyces atroroseus]|uniref:Uncharacterized protein n=1 Tax=Talaromyces atroroseus TaxID=1441469 RepID=A0A225AUB0_TALAT|nr:hypothetical protein UA08_07394 [Talaromyces atroroseus]OKL57057.1 hypothetical protein UA08_07394 [Talaromyces atroroseus]